MLKFIIYAIIIGIIFIEIKIGYKKGLLRTAFLLTSSILSIIFGMILSPIVADSINKNEFIKKDVYENIYNIVDTVVKEKEEEQAKEITIFSIKLDEQMTETLFNATKKVRTNIVDNITNSIVRSISYLIAFIVTFVIVKIIFMYIFFVIKIIEKIPLIGGINRLAGGFLGAFEGIIIVWVIFTILTFSQGYQNVDKTINEIKEDKYLNYLYEKNIFLNNYFYDYFNILNEK